MLIILYNSEWKKRDKAKRVAKEREEKKVSHSET